MSYRIRYEVKPKRFWVWGALGALIWCAVSLGPVWEIIAAGEGLYDALARYVGGMILGPR